jgi:diguanylate cyclase (GGDEF)-like protein
VSEVPWPSHPGLEAISRLGLLEREGDPALTALVRVASYVTGAVAAAVHVLDDVAQHRVAAVNAPLGEHPREDSMCRLVVDDEQRIVCADATEEPRLGYSSFVQGPEPVRFYASVPLRTADGAVVGTLCAWDTVARELSREQVTCFEDLAEQAVSRLELTRIARDLGTAATRDPLTGAVNRLLLNDRLAQMFARRRRHGGEVLVVLVDVDEFKTINDTYGHDAGDRVLVSVAHRLMDCTREQDTVARLGGDEFVVIAEAADGDGSASIVERIEASLAAPVDLGATVYPVGVTIGAVLAEPGDDVRLALERADRAMYERKPRRRGGRRP